MVNQSEKGKSGFGFELTFRLKREADETKPPVWPAKLMQQLAKYVFTSGKLIFLQLSVWMISIDFFFNSLILMKMFQCR